MCFYYNKKKKKAKKKLRKAPATKLARSTMPGTQQILTTCLLETRVIVLIVSCLDIPVFLTIHYPFFFFGTLRLLSIFCFYKQHLDLALQLNFCVHTVCFLMIYFWESHGSYFLGLLFHYQIASRQFVTVCHSPQQCREQIFDRQKQEIEVPGEQPLHRRGALVTLMLKFEGPL